MTSADVRDILEIDSSEQQAVTKESLFNDDKKKKKKPEQGFKRPEGMHREVWGLLYTDPRDVPAMMQSDASLGYKSLKAKIGRSKVRPWKWMPFTNPARKDGAIFYHWRRVADEGKDYPFAKFNKPVEVPSYSDLEYQMHLHDDNWTMEETDHLVNLCSRFDFRFIVIRDRYDRSRFPERSVEDLKERYYSVVNALARARSEPGVEPKIYGYDADHERRRKLQLEKLYNRTPEQVEEEEFLIQEMRKIEQRKKEREKKAQDLQKLITAADNSGDLRRTHKKIYKKVQQRNSKGGETNANPDTTGIKFPEFKMPGVTVRSQKMKLPNTIGQKKTKAIELLLEELGLEMNPMPTEEIVSNFNELRCDMVLLYELKLATANCEFELQTLKHRLEALSPGKLATLNLPTTLPAGPAAANGTEESPNKARKISEIIDVVGSPGTPSVRSNLFESIEAWDRNISPSRKRRAALEQHNIMRKLKGQKT